MKSQRYIALIKWIIALGMVALIALVYHRWTHVNTTTVALTLVMCILLIAARFGLRYAVGASLIATALYNFYFLPPVGTFTIADPENWLALFAFLATGVVGSRLSEQARDEASIARVRRREVELLLAVSRELLQTDNVAELVTSLPVKLVNVSGASSAMLFLIDGDRLYRAGLQHGREGPAEFRQLALSLPDIEITPDHTVRIPLRAGVRPRGLLALTDLRLSDESFRAIGGLISIAIDRAHALENVAGAEANKEGERLRTVILDSITHELRTPLTAIKGAATTLLSNSGVSPADTRELLSIVNEEADRLNHLVGQAVEMAQIETREVHMNFEAIDIALLINDAREHCAWVFAERTVTAQADRLPKVSADPRMISKVLCNLLENAARYSAQGTPIFVSAAVSGDFVEVSVADRGVGIDASEQSLIFDRLYRSRSHHLSTSGTGMGLPISRAIVESHGGRLTVTSQLGQGSVFTFSLPIAQVRATHRTHDQPSLVLTTDG